MQLENTVWIKTHLHKDGTAQWDGVDGDQQAVKAKLNELCALGYHPVIDHEMSHPKPQFYTLLRAEDGLYKKPHVNRENALQHVKYQMGENAGRGFYGWYDDWGRSMSIIDIETACSETLQELDRAMVDNTGLHLHSN